MPPWLKFTASEGIVVEGCSLPGDWQTKSFVAAWLYFKLSVAGA
jgi:hypothetical protein